MGVKPGAFFDRDSLRRKRYDGPREIVPVPSDQCPECGESGLHRFEQIEPALLRHGGFGAARRTVTLSCSCGWLIEEERSEVHPDSQLSTGASGEVAS